MSQVPMTILVADDEIEIHRIIAAALDGQGHRLVDAYDGDEALEKAIKNLDKSVSEATETRKEEHEDFTELMASNSAAKELLGFAKNRLI